MKGYLAVAEHIQQVTLRCGRFGNTPTRTPGLSRVPETPELYKARLPAETRANRRLSRILSTQLHAHTASGLPGQASAFGTAFWWSLGFTVIAIIPALALPRRTKDQPDDSNPASAPVRPTPPAQPTEPELGTTKSPANAKPASRLTFSVRPGEVTGFLGRNGAGKTTTLRMILGLQRPTSGTVTVDGRPYADLVAPLRHVGSLLDARAVRPGCTAASVCTCTGHDYSQPGKPRIDWDDPAAKDALVSALVNDANALVAALADRQLDEQGAWAVALLALVAGQDVEPAEGSDGTDGRWRIARKVAEDRVISVHDPEARHRLAAAWRLRQADISGKSDHVADPKGPGLLPQRRPCRRSSRPRSPIIQRAPSQSGCRGSRHQPARKTFHGSISAHDAGAGHRQR